MEKQIKIELEKTKATIEKMRENKFAFVNKTLDIA